MIEAEACSGCAACKQICPQQCITMQYDKKGFLYPVVDESNCVKCGSCIEACKKAHEDNIVTFKTYIAYALDDEIRKTSSSGGIFQILAKYVLSKKGVVFGAVFDEEYRVIHKKTDIVEELNLYKGSKYVQSNVLNTYKEAREYLDRNVLVLYTGTPCQVAGLYGFLNGRRFENLISVSLICHGVPSPGIWDRYLAIQKANYNSSINKVSFREKNEEYEWGNYHLNIQFDGGGNYDCPWYDDLYFQGFEYDFFTRSSCAKCSSKGVKQKGDIIIGDYWKALDDEKYAKLNGVSSLVTLTENGENIIKKCSRQLNVIPCEYKDIRAKNEALDTSVVNMRMSSVFWDFYLSTGNLLNSIQSTKNKFNESNFEIVPFDTENETIIVWGMGKIFNEYIAVLQQRKRVDYICDNNETLVGKRVKNIFVISPNDLKKLKNPYVIIMVDNINYVVQIIKKLHDVGVKKYDLWRTLIKAR